jgi:hypothetical protein
MGIRGRNTISDTVHLHNPGNRNIAVAVRKELLDIIGSMD